MTVRTNRPGCGGYSGEGRKTGRDGQKKNGKGRTKADKPTGTVRKRKKTEKGWARADKQTGIGREREQKYIGIEQGGTVWRKNSRLRRSQKSA